MSVRLPSRYEDLDPAFRGRLRPNRPLVELVRRAHQRMTVSGGIRFLPIYGRSGSGKSSAARELATHLPESKVLELSRAAILSEAALLQEVRAAIGRRNKPRVLIAVVDQYEENVSDKSSVPTQFVERLSLLDRGALRDVPVLFLWLTTSSEFQAELARATSRNERILVASDFELVGPERDDWAEIVEETFSFHNQEQPLADFGVLRESIEASVDGSATLGSTIESVGDLLADPDAGLQDLSQYQVVMLWPVTDGHRITRVSGFTDARDGYKLDWNAFYRELNADDRRTLPLSELNRARLYFDVRLVPIAAADLQPLCRDLDDLEFSPSRSYLERFGNSHFVSILREAWDPTSFSPMRERESQRADAAKAWYDGGVTQHPTKIGRRIAKCLRELGLDATHEEDITSPHSTVRADVAVKRPGSQQTTCIIELKAYSTDGTMPSSIKDAIRTTLKRHAQLAGFLARQ
ncbi:ATP-binding protein [Curtobacterium sp. NPDC098951]|uniref:ATP-binding protein n=1 Tax=Curtobacterium sp. NPDC098951 TaxID=3363974 RepID=UPI00382DC6D9